MVLVNYTTRELTAKLVYYGPGLCGKTTNLQYIFDNLLPVDRRGKMVSLATETDRTLFFDFLPLELGTIRGLKTRVQLYTVPGQVHYNATRKIVLKGADGIVFVADSQPHARQANIESVANMKANLVEHGLDLAQLPHVFQFNKRDLADAMPVEQMESDLNQHNAPFWEASAVAGIGVEDTLKSVVRLVLKHLAQRFQGEVAAAGEPERPAPAAVSAPAAVPAPPGETPAELADEPAVEAPAPIEVAGPEATIAAPERGPPPLARDAGPLELDLGEAEADGGPDEVLEVGEDVLLVEDEEPAAAFGHPTPPDGTGPDGTGPDGTGPDGTGLEPAPTIAIDDFDLPVVGTEAPAVPGAGWAVLPPSEPEPVEADRSEMDLAFERGDTVLSVEGDLGAGPLTGDDPFSVDAEAPVEPAATVGPASFDFGLEDVESASSEVESDAVADAGVPAALPLDAVPLDAPPSLETAAPIEAAAPGAADRAAPPVEVVELPALTLGRIVGEEVVERLVRLPVEFTTLAAGRGRRVLEIRLRFRLDD